MCTRGRRSRCARTWRRRGSTYHTSRTSTGRRWLLRPSSSASAMRRSVHPTGLLPRRRSISTLRCRRSLSLSLSRGWSIRPRLYGRRSSSSVGAAWWGLHLRLAWWSCEWRTRRSLSRHRATMGRGRSILCRCRRGHYMCRRRSHSHSRRWSHTSSRGRRRIWTWTSLARSRGRRHAPHTHTHTHRPTRNTARSWRRR